MTRRLETSAPGGGGAIVRVPGAVNFNPALEYSGQSYMGSAANLSNNVVTAVAAGSGFGVGYVSDQLLTLARGGGATAGCGTDRCDAGTRTSATNFGKAAAAAGAVAYATASTDGPDANVYGFWANNTGTGHQNSRNGATNSGSGQSKQDYNDYQLRIGSFPGYAYSQTNNALSTRKWLTEGLYYSRKVSDAEAQRIISYLAIKYGVTLDANGTRRNATNFSYQSSTGATVWAGNDANYSGFHSNVIGIARDGALDQRIARSVNGGNGTESNVLDILTLASGALSSPDQFTYTLQTNADGSGPGNGVQLQQGQYLMVGRDAGTVTGVTTVAVSGSAPTLANGSWSRLNRRWRAQNTGGVGTVSLRFELPPAGVTALGGNLNRVALLVDNDGNYANGGTRVVTAGRSVSGNSISFNVTLANGEVFTLAVATPVLSKAFSPTTIPTGATSTLTFTLSNHGVETVSGINFTDTMPSAVRVANPANVRTNCPSGGAMSSALPTGMSVSATPGSNIIQVTGAQVQAASGGVVSTCQVAVDVTSAAAGSYVNGAAAISALANLSNGVTNQTLVVTAQPNFGMCDGRMFQSIGDNIGTEALHRIDATANPLVYQSLGSGSDRYNAHGYNPLDNYIYGIRNAPANLVRVGADGSTTVLGAVNNLPINTSFNSGTVSPDGKMYVRAQNGGVLYVIDLAALPARNATAITLSGLAVSIADLAWHNGLLYTVAIGTGRLVSINPATGAMSYVGPSNNITTAFGALFGTPTAIYGANNDGGFYQFSPTTGVATLISSSPPASSNDGSNCPNAEITFAADLSITKDDGSATYAPGTGVAYTIVARNSGPFGVADARVLDSLPAGITSATWTCVGAGGGTCTASGTGAIDDLVNLPVNATATYTLNIDVPSGRSGDLVNTASITPPLTSTDPVPGNNSATDTDTQASVAGLSVTKTNTPAQGAIDLDDDVLMTGSTTLYQLVVGNAGPSDANGAILRDPAPTGLTCTAVSCTGATGGAACPATLDIASLQGSGVVIDTLPANSSVTLEVGCTVD